MKEEKEDELEHDQVTFALVHVSVHGGYIEVFCLHILC